MSQIAPRGLACPTENHYSSLGVVDTPSTRAILQSFLAEGGPSAQESLERLRNLLGDLYDRVAWLAFFDDIDWEPRVRAPRRSMDEAFKLHVRADKGNAAEQDVHGDQMERYRNLTRVRY